ncbi:MAG: class I tRNA ligase family protein, partial [Candidatus Omnitrophica bacterium]|nr:class I tRNA ligase family protein [Candidatus Omnitrophota bacterium]
AIEAVQTGKITFHPARWEKVYMNWMENIRDWCISRQIWWGHRIPVWYDEDGNEYAALDEEEAKKLSGKDNLRQDDDVLDTWFSSWLWPFATFGWPQENEDLKFFYPGDALFTASEIIFFWVARMIMAGYEFMGDVPFKDVYIHGTVRDNQGRKMSKSLGNAIDPLEIVEEYGGDALRFSLIHNSGQDLYISKDNFEVGRNFANKIWNASRLVLMNVTETPPEKLPEPADLASRWIVSRLYTTVSDVSRAIETFHYSEAENLIYDFFWNNFCDWYLEIIKDRWSDPLIQQTAVGVLSESLKMMHPFIPFVTEEIWEHLHKDKGPLCRQPWPVIHQPWINEQAEKDMAALIDMIVAVRNIRSTWNIGPKESVNVTLEAGNGQLELILANEALIKARANIGRISASDNAVTTNCATAIVGKIKLAVPLGDLIDIAQEKKRIAKKLEDLKKNHTALDKRLNNDNFLAKAPAEVVAKEKERLAAFGHEISELETVLRNLQ